MPGKHRWQLKQRPREYPATPQQQRFRKALETCGIKKGITKADLMLKMRDCLPRYFREVKEHHAD